MCSLVEELAIARRKSSQLNGEVPSLRIQTERLESERKNLMEILNVGAIFHRRKRTRTDSTGGDAPCKT